MKAILFKNARLKGKFSMKDLSSHCIKYTRKV